MKMKIEFEHYTAGDASDDTGKTPSPGETSPSGAPSPWPRRIKRLLFGPLDLPPLTRRQFARLIPELFFVRQILQTIMGCSLLYIIEEENGLYTLYPFVSVVLIVSLLCFYIPYYRYIYLRLKKTIFFFPRFWFSIIFFKEIFFMEIMPDEMEPYWAIVDFILIWTLYIIVFLFPDNKENDCY